MTRCPGPLELLHPDGLARRAVVLGGACPARLRPGAPEGEPKWDLVVIAPTAAEARSRDWVADSVRRTVGGLADDGLAYVLGAAGARRRIAGALEREGLRTSGRFAHLPDIASSELIVPLRPRAARAATGRLERPYARQLARAALAVPGAAALIGRCGDPIGIVARRHAARPLAMWLGAAPDAEGIGSIRTRWRADRVRTLVHLISGEGAFVKLASGAGGEGAVRRECAALARLGAAARASGARIPESELIGDREACPALRLGMVPGVPARAILARSPSRRDEILAAVGRWLEAWSRGTRRVARLDPQRLEGWVLEPARRLAGAFDRGAEYVAWLETRCRTLGAGPVPLVASHNDLTMANLLIDGDELGVLDWEAATEEGLPIRDFAYAAVDATAACERYRDRPAAFESCFGRPGSELVRGMLARLRSAVEATDEWVTLAFHACWLQHAEDERRKRAPGEALPFLECARRAAALRWQA